MSALSPTSEDLSLELQEMVDIRHPSRWNGLDSVQISFDIHGAKQLIEQDRERTINKAFEQLLLNAGSSEYIQQLIEHTKKGVCANCGGDGHNMLLEGPAVCGRCSGTGRFSPEVK